jgi:hypothetical protein
MANLQEIHQKIKSGADSFLAEWGIFALIILASLGSFGLGRLSALEAQKPLITVSEASQTALVGSLTQGGMLVATRNGETYSFPWCAGASQISPANQRVFANEAAAKKAGYRPAKNCKGLEQ